MKQIFTKYSSVIDKISVNMIFVFFSIAFLIRNLLIPLVADDYSYAFIWNGDGGGNILYNISPDLHRINSFHDILLSQWSHYFTWGGRTVAHTLVQLFVWFGKPLFDIANTIVFITLVLLIFKLSNISYKSITRLSLMWILIGIWVCVSDFIGTIIWLTGSCNYLWMSVLQLIFLVPYLLSLYSNQNISPVLMFPLGVLAGWSNEIGGFSVLFIAVSIMILMKSKRTLQNWAITGLAAFIIGYSLLIFAPGNFHRAVISNTNFHYSMELFMSYLKGPFQNVMLHESVLYIPIIYYFVKQRHNLNINLSMIFSNPSSIIKKFSAEEITILLFTIAGLMIPILMLFSPEFPLRSCFMSPILLLVASTTAIKQLKINNLNYALKYIVSTIWLISIAGAFYADCSVYRQMQQRLELIEQQRDNDLVSVPRLHGFNRLGKVLGLRIYISEIGDLDSDPLSGHNIVFAKYYNVKQIVTYDNSAK